MKQTLSLSVTAVVVIILQFCSTVPASAQYYDIEILRAKDDAYSEAHDINKYGEVSGEAITLDDRHSSVVWLESSWTNIGILPTFDYCQGTALNDYSEVVGDCFVDDAPPINRAYYWSSSEGLINLSTLGGYADGKSIARDINNSGTVVGESTINGWNSLSHAFVWNEKDGMQDLGSIEPGYASSAFGINQRGDIVGYSYVQGSKRHAFYKHFLSDNLQDLGTLAGGNSEAHAINKLGQIVGKSNLRAGSNLQRAVLWQEGDIEDLGTLGGEEGVANDINDEGEIVGYSYTADTWRGQVAFIWKDGQMRRLDDFIYGNSTDVNKKTWILSEAKAINKDGEVVGVSHHGSYGFLLKPIKDLRVDDPQDGGSGKENTVNLYGAKPGMKLRLYYGLREGSTPVSRCTDTVVRIQNALVADEVIADDNGHAVFTGYVPSAAAGREIFFQVVEDSGTKRAIDCRLSNLKRFTFE